MEAEQLDTKELLLRAAERLFARDGIHRVPLREINALAGQRNPSALHYHYGNREALVEAIIFRHVQSIEQAMADGLDALEGRGGDITVRDVVGVVVRPMVAKLDTESGRDWLRIITQTTPDLGRNLRKGLIQPSTPQTTRVLGLLRERMTHVPEKVLRERLVAYVLMLSTLFADRAHLIEAGEPMPLGPKQFEAHVIDMIEALLLAPSTVSPRRSRS